MRPARGEPHLHVVRPAKDAVVLPVIIDVNLEEAPACRLGFRGLHDVLCERIERGVRSPCGLDAVAQEDVQILASTLSTGVPVELKVPR